MTLLYLFYTSQMTGSAQNVQIGTKGTRMGQKGPKEVKRCQKGSNGAKIYISRTFGRRNLVDPSF